MGFFIRNTIMISSRTGKKLTFKAQTLATGMALVGAVLLPQLIHVLGKALGVGTALGGALLPMHLPIILAGMMAGPFVGGIAGAFAPLLSYALTGMPYINSLPFMMVEVCFYGAVAGLIKNVNMPLMLKVLLAQIGGRAMRAVAVAIAVYGLGFEGTSLMSLLISIPEGILGLALQWAVIPVVVYAVNRKVRE